MILRSSLECHGLYQKPEKCACGCCWPVGKRWWPFGGSSTGDTSHIEQVTGGCGHIDGRSGTGYTSWWTSTQCYKNEGTWPLVHYFNNSGNWHIILTNHVLIERIRVHLPTTKILPPFVLVPSPAYTSYYVGRHFWSVNFRMQPLDGYHAALYLICGLDGWQNLSNT